MSVVPCATAGRSGQMNVLQGQKNEQVRSTIFVFRIFRCRELRNTKIVLNIAFSARKKRFY